MILNLGCGARRRATETGATVKRAAPIQTHSCVSTDSAPQGLCDSARDLLPRTNTPRLRRRSLFRRSTLPDSGAAPFEPVGILRIAPLPCIMETLYTMGRILSIAFSKKCYAINIFLKTDSLLIPTFPNWEWAFPWARVYPPQTEPRWAVLRRWMRRWDTRIVVSCHASTLFFYSTIIAQIPSNVKPPRINYAGAHVLPKQQQKSQQDHRLINIPPILTFPALMEQKQDQPQDQKLLEPNAVAEGKMRQIEQRRPHRGSRGR